MKPFLVVRGLLLTRDDVEVRGLEIHGLVHPNPQVLLVSLARIDRGLLRGLLFRVGVIGARTSSSFRSDRMSEKSFDPLAGWHVNEFRHHYWLTSTCGIREIR
jgi:hypothetical protein